MKQETQTNAPHPSPQIEAEAARLQEEQASHYQPSADDRTSGRGLEGHPAVREQVNFDAEEARVLSPDARRGVPRAQPPEEAEGPRLSSVPRSAGGLPAVISPMKHSWREMGAGRSLKTLLSVHQQGGFDCPGCAWPEPDGERSHAEVCENGAKAVAAEATTRRVTAELFR